MCIIKVVDEKFGKYIKKMKWINFGGGYYIIREDYDIEILIKFINFIKDKYGVKVYFELGEVIVLNVGFFVLIVLDIMKNGMDIVILDILVECYMLDVFVMLYRFNIIGVGKLNEFEFIYRFGGLICFVGDIIGDYLFKEFLKLGDKLVFCDMVIYLMVKNNIFNGVNFLFIVKYSEEKGIEIIK